MKLLLVVGTRPNLMKASALLRAFRAEPAIGTVLVHTGQHYDDSLSGQFFTQLGLSAPDYALNVSPGSITQQTVSIMARLEPVLLAEQPDWVVVIGDVTSTLSAARVANQLRIRVAHVEAGLRSFDHTMPEETNRVLTDELADVLFVTEQSGIDNLLHEGIPPEKIQFVGNVLIDALVHCRPKANRLNTVGALGLIPKQYALMTMHRPANVDTKVGLQAVLHIAETTARQLTVVLPLHPRTRAGLVRFGLFDTLTQLKNVRLLEPQGYLEFLNLLEHAAVVLTDSGGVQEETTFLNVPCLTLRTTTERPATITHGTNQLIPSLDPVIIQEKITEIRVVRVRPDATPPLWDGRAAERIRGFFLNSDTTKTE
ncbi:MAG: UDP-N-acetylglucosamine 2-epimerase (non-hydrolyzing) [Spirosoma sp.]|nr:UDP-N-acetylglucosamine 2-epimerase (non-hydrolyzing) [Spirosoma sp.]